MNYLLEDKLISIVNKQIKTYQESQNPIRNKIKTQ